jgi:hypothetical protein
MRLRQFDDRVLHQASLQTRKHASVASCLLAAALRQSVLLWVARRSLPQSHFAHPALAVFRTAIRLHQLQSSAPWQYACINADPRAMLFGPLLADQVKRRTVHKDTDNFLSR